MMISNALQERIESIDILASVSSDHSPVFMKINENIETNKNKNYWKFNTSLLKNAKFASEMSQSIESWKAEFANLRPQELWEMIKYKIRNFCIKFSKVLAKERREKTEKLENIIKTFETNSDPFITSEQYLAAKLEFESILNERTTGQILRSKIRVYESNEKSSKYFLSLEKKNAVQNTIKLLKDNAEITVTDPIKVSNEIKTFYSRLFKRYSNRTQAECKEFLDNIDLPKVTNDQNEMLKKQLTLEELELAIKSSDNGRSPGNDGLPREFYVFFWRNISKPLHKSLLDARERGSLSASQRQAVIKLLEKKGKDKRFIRNWPPISLINFDAKLLSKTLADRLKQTLPSLINPDQTAYVKNRFLGESVRVISDILDVTKSLNIDGYMLTMDIEKAFDSMNFCFLFEVLKKLNF